MTNLDSILKSRDITLPTQVRLVKVMVSPVVMYGCESWTVKNAECQRIDGFELWCWKRLESPLDCKEIQPVHSKGDQPWDFFGRNDAKAETLILWPPHKKSWLIGKDWCWEGLGAEGEGDDRGWDGWMTSPIQWTWVWVNSGSWWGTGRPGVLQSMGLQRVRHDWATELNDWLNWDIIMITCVHAMLLHFVWLFGAIWTEACQAPLSMRLTRQEYWSGLPCPPSGNLLDPGSNLRLLHCRQILYSLSHQEDLKWFKQLDK